MSPTKIGYLNERVIILHGYSRKKIIQNDFLVFSMAQKALTMKYIRPSGQHTNDIFNRNIPSSLIFRRWSKKFAPFNL